MKNSEFMDEYLNRLAFALAQFWQAGESLPDAEAEEDEVYYRVAIRRLSTVNRAELAKKMHRLRATGANFFTPGVAPETRKAMIEGVIARFPLLQDAAHEALVMSDRI